MFADNKLIVALLMLVVDVCSGMDVLVYELRIEDPNAGRGAAPRAVLEQDILSPMALT